MISLSNDLLQHNPAYNHSIITYTSDSVLSPIKSEIQIGDNIFTVYPFENTFKFNFEDIVKVLINPNGFRDVITPNFDNTFIYSDSTLSLTIDPIITIYGIDSSDVITKSYSFYKGVEQLGNYQDQLSVDAEISVLAPRIVNDFYLTYFEGYPFDFGIRGLTLDDTFYFKNLNSNQISETFISENDSVKRVYLSDGGTDITIDDSLVMTSNLNRLELYVNDNFISNIYIKKVESKCGVYLKWFNQFGSYSYWLFNGIYSESTRIKEIGEVVGKWANLQEINSTSESLGVTASKTLSLTTSYTQVEMPYLTDISKSPKVEKYNRETPFSKININSFFGVKAVSNSNFNNKLSNNKLNLTLELPEINTITY